MRRALATLAVALGMTGPVQVAVALEPASRLERPDPQGGVLCVWNILLIAQAMADMCFPDQDPELKAFLRDSISKIDDFVVANGPATIEQIEQGKKLHRDDQLALMTTKARESEPEVDLCKSKTLSSAVGLYEHLRRQPLESARADISKLLAVPRKPSWGPCL